MSGLSGSIQRAIEQINKREGKTATLLLPYLVSFCLRRVVFFYFNCAA